MTSTITVGGLTPNASYDFYLIVGGTFGTTFTINGSSGNTTGNTGPNLANWVEGTQYAKITGTADGAGSLDIVLTDNNTATNAAGAISGMQIVDSTPGPTVSLFYADSATTTGGQFDASYSPTNMLTEEFTSPSVTINATGTPDPYTAPGNNYASVSGTTDGFDLTFEFAGPATVDGMHVWNYVFYSSTGGGAASPNSGVNAYTLTFYDGPSGTGSQVGSVFSGNLNKAV